MVKGGPLTFESIHRLLIIQLGDIGDVVLTTPSIVALRERFPRSEITVAVRRKAKELMDDCPLVDKVIVADKNTGPLLKQWAEMRSQIRTLRKTGFDLAIDFRTGTRGAVLAWLSGAPRRVAFYADNETFLA